MRGLFARAQAVNAQPSIVDGKTNLIVNGGAEAGPAGTPTELVTTIPGWTRAGNANVFPCDLTGYVLTSDPAPPDNGFNYFTGAIDGYASTLTQDIDVSLSASTINGGNVKYTAAFYLGGLRMPAQMTVTFKNASGQAIISATQGPVGLDGLGMSLQQQIGLVPARRGLRWRLLSTTRTRWPTACRSCSVRSVLRPIPCSAPT